MTAADLAKVSREELIETILRLDHELTWLKRQLFGQKSERFVSNDQQMSLELGVPASGDAPTKTERVTYDRKVPQKQEGHCRGPMPTHLPIKDIVLDPEGNAPGGECIGEEITWEYAIKRGSLYVRRYRRRKFAAANGEGVAIAPLPPRPIEKGNASASLLANVIVDKYLYHMPLDRQRRKYQTEYQVEFPESTLCDWVRQSCFWFEPVYEVLSDQVRRAAYIQADETPIPVLVRDGKHKTHKGYYWVYHAVLEDITVFVYSESRARAGPNEFLKAFKGTLQVDGYAGYNDVLSRGDVIWAACMAHVRRKFEESLKSSREEATYALETMKPWFRVETECKQEGVEHEGRLAIRQAHTAPSMEDFHGWLKDHAMTALPKSPLGQAVAYALNQWKGFDPFLTDGRVELSTNFVENQIRPVALGRKNYLFKGSHAAAQRGAMIYSLCGTATRNEIDPYLYLCDLLERLPAAQSTEVEQYTPAQWKPRYLEHAKAAAARDD